MLDGHIAKIFYQLVKFIYFSLSSSTIAGILFFLQTRRMYIFSL